MDLDKKGRAVTGLNADNFEVYDNGRKQTVRLFQRGDEKLARLTDDFYAIGGGARAYQIKGDIAFEGGPGIRYAMLNYARSRNMLPC